MEILGRAPTGGVSPEDIGEGTPGPESRSMLRSNHVGSVTSASSFVLPKELREISRFLRDTLEPKLCKVSSQSVR